MVVHARTAPIHPVFGSVSISISTGASIGHRRHRHHRHSRRGIARAGRSRSGRSVGRRHPFTRSLRSRPTRTSAPSALEPTHPISWSSLEPDSSRISLAHRLTFSSTGAAAGHHRRALPAAFAIARHLACTARMRAWSSSTSCSLARLPVDFDVSHKQSSHLLRTGVLKA